jgi:hypothetical protein
MLPGGAQLEAALKPKPAAAAAAAAADEAEEEDSKSPSREATPEPIEQEEEQPAASQQQEATQKTNTTQENRSGGRQRKHSGRCRKGGKSRSLVDTGRPHVLWCTLVQEDVFSSRGAGNRKSVSLFCTGHRGRRVRCML